MILNSILLTLISATSYADDKSLSLIFEQRRAAALNKQHHETLVNQARELAKEFITVEADWDSTEKTGQNTLIFQLLNGDVCSYQTDHQCNATITKIECYPPVETEREGYEFSKTEEGSSAPCI